MSQQVESTLVSLRLYALQTRRAVSSTAIHHPVIVINQENYKYMMHKQSNMLKISCFSPKLSDSNSAQRKLYFYYLIRYKGNKVK